MRKVVIYSNCQGDGIAYHLKYATAWTIEVFRNYQMILGEQKIEDLERAVRDCDAFVYQPTDEKHGRMSSEAILALLPEHADRVSFGYGFNHGRFPIVEYGGRFIGPDYQATNLEDALAFYDKGEFTQGMGRRFEECLTEQSRRERECDVTMAGWILDHHDQRLFLNVNHPTTIYFAELAARVLKCLGRAMKAPFSWTSENEIHLPCSLPLSREEIEVFGMKRDPDPDSYEYYRTIVVAAFNTKR